MEKKLKLSIFLLISFATARALGAPCCGSNSYLPAIISGDDKSQVTASMSFSQVVAEANTAGNVIDRAAGQQEDALTTKIDAATLLSDRWQAGISVPLKQRGRNNFSSTGLGDVALSVAYEAVPDWEYSSWRPKVFVYAQGRFPTGRSRFQATQPYAIDSTGKGFFGTSMGAMAIKSWGNFDLSLLADLGRSFPRSFNGNRHVPGWSASSTLGFGYSPGGGALRIGMALSAGLENAIEVQGSAPQLLPRERTMDPSIQISYLASNQWSMSLSYTDQTLLAGSENTSLGRSLSFILQRRWAR